MSQTIHEVMERLAQRTACATITPQWVAKVFGRDTYSTRARAWCDRHGCRMEVPMTTWEAVRMIYECWPDVFKGYVNEAVTPAESLLTEINAPTVGHEISEKAEGEALEDGSPLRVPGLSDPPEYLHERWCDVYIMAWDKIGGSISDVEGRSHMAAKHAAAFLDRFIGSFAKEEEE